MHLLQSLGQALRPVSAHTLLKAKEKRESNEGEREHQRQRRALWNSTNSYSPFKVAEEWRNIPFSFFEERREKCSSSSNWKNFFCRNKLSPHISKMSFQSILLNKQSSVVYICHGLFGQKPKHAYFCPLFVSGLGSGSSFWNNGLNQPCATSSMKV